MPVSDYELPVKFDAPAAFELSGEEPDDRQ